MQPLDGNAIGGQLWELFGSDMTVAHTVCASCGASGLVAELAVYLRAPGTVVRCPVCEAVLMVLATVRGITCVDVAGLARFELVE